jgi:hypothetical protein
MPRGLGVVGYGSEGVGKTSWAIQHAHLGSLDCFSIKETGYEDLEIIGEVPEGCNNYNVETWEALNGYLKKSTAEVWIIDGLSGLQKILFDYVCRTVYDGVWKGKDGFTGYWKGQRVDSPPILMSLLDNFSRERANGRHIILLGHMITETETNTLGADFLSHTIDMDQGDKGGCRGCITQWAQAVLFMHIDVSITRSTETERNVVLEGKAKEDADRLMYTTKSAGHVAKNRLGLPPIISMGHSAKEAFQNYWKEMPPVYQDLI